MSDGLQPSQGGRQPTCLAWLVLTQVRKSYWWEESQGASSLSRWWRSVTLMYCHLVCPPSMLSAVSSLSNIALSTAGFPSSRYLPVQPWCGFRLTKEISKSKLQSKTKIDKDWTSSNKLNTKILFQTIHKDHIDI